MNARRRHGGAAILLISTHYHPILGGVESHARDVAMGLRARGRRVTVLTTLVDQASRRISVIDRVPVVRTPPAAGRRRFSKWLFLPVAAVVAARMARHYDVIFCPDVRAVGIAAILAGWWAHRPVVLQGATPGAFSMAHWDDSARALKLPARGPLLFVAKTIVSAIHRRAAAVTCITKAHAAEAESAGVPTDRIHYVPHGVDTSRFVPASPQERAILRGRLGWPQSTVVLFLGRISQEKGVLELLQAWRKVSVRHPGASLQLVGPDEPGHQLDAGRQAQAFIESHGLTSVTLAGPTTDAASVIRAADVLVLPSHYEAFPLTVIEAMATGLPVVASFVGGLQDYLVDGENALTVPPGDVDSLVRALDRILDDGALRQRLGHAGRETVLASFDRRLNLARYGAIFDRVAGMPA